jgi:hypothetical protein
LRKQKQPSLRESTRFLVIERQAGFFQGGRLGKKYFLRMSVAIKVIFFD